MALTRIFLSKDENCKSFAKFKTQNSIFYYIVYYFTAAQATGNRFAKIEKASCQVMIKSMYQYRDCY